MIIDFFAGTNPILDFTVVTKEHGNRPLVVEVKHNIHCGRSGKDKEEVEKHLKDLETFGIPRDKYPLKGPVAFLVPTFNATVSQNIQVYDNATNSEIEPVLLIDSHDNVYVTVGSDHVDRDMEKKEKPKGRLYNAKIMSREVWPFEEVEDHWEELILRLYGYPTGGPGAYTYPKGERVLGMDSKWGINYGGRTLIDRAKAQTGLEDLRNSVLFGGTFPWLTGEFMWGPAWDLEMFDPVLNRTIKHHYEVEVVWHRVPPFPTEGRPPEI